MSKHKDSHNLLSAKDQAVLKMLDQMGCEAVEVSDPKAQPILLPSIPKVEVQEIGASAAQTENEN